MAKRTITIPDDHWHAFEVEAARVTLESLKVEGAKVTAGDVLRDAVARHCVLLAKREAKR